MRSFRKHRLSSSMNSALLIFFSFLILRFLFVYSFGMIANKQKEERNEKIKFHVCTA